MIAVWFAGLALGGSPAELPAEVRLTLQAAAALDGPSLPVLARARGLSQTDVAEHLQQATNAGLAVEVDDSEIRVDAALADSLAAETLDVTAREWRRRGDQAFVAVSGGLGWVLPRVGAEVWGSRRRLAIAGDLAFLALPEQGGATVLAVPTLTVRRHVGDGRWTGDVGLAGGLALSEGDDAPLAFLDLGLRWHGRTDGPHPFVRAGAGVGGIVITGFEGGLFPLPVLTLAVGYQT